MLIDVIESAYQTRNHYLVVSVVSALRSLPDVTQVRLLELSDALLQTRQKVPDLLIVFGGEQCDNFVIQRLCERARVSAVWFTEDPFEFKHNLRNCVSFDLVFTNDKASAAGYGAKGRHLPLAANADHVARATPFAKRRYDISFVGTLWPNRARFFSEASGLFDGFKTKFEFTDNEYLRPALAKFKLPWRIGSGVDYADFMRINQNSRISLMIDREFSGSEQSPISDTPGPRFFEAASAGACLFVDTRVMGDVEAFGFAPDRDYFRFSNVDEFKDLLAEFSRSHSPFEAATLALREKVLAAHTYAHRVHLIVELAKARIHNPPLVVTNDPPAKPRILALAHNLVQFGGFGGAELYLQKLVERSPQYDVFIFAHDSRQGFGARYVVVGPDETTFREFLPKIPFSDLHLRHPELEQFFLGIIEELRPDLLLVNHLIGFPPSLAMLAAYCDLRSIAVLHDYYLVCDAFDLLMYDQSYCDAPEYPAHRCDLCAYKRRGLPPGSMSRRRNVFRYVLDSVDVAVSNTMTVAKLIETVSDVDMSGCVIIEPPRMMEPVPPVRDAVGLNKVALIGNLFPHKGSDDLFEIALAVRDLPIAFHVFGNCDKRLLSQVTNAGLGNVVFHGAHVPGDIDPVILECEAALFLSRWPETYCMSLDEAIAHGLVPIAYRIGALAERIHDEIGFLTDCHPTEISDLLRALHRDPTPLAARCRKLRNTPQRTDVFAAKYHALFERLLENRQQATTKGLANLSFESSGFAWIPGQWNAPQPFVDTIRRKKPKRGVRKIASKVWKKLRFWRRA